MDRRGRARAKDPGTGIHKPTQRRLTDNEVNALVGQLRDIVAVLADADPVENGPSTYEELGVVNLTYHPEGGYTKAQGTPCTRGSCRRGKWNLKYTRPLGDPHPCGRLTFCEPPQRISS
ncbi:MAG: hypothetical protein ACRDWA_18380 [Acidimicrobiia bacterium]